MAWHGEDAHFERYFHKTPKRNKKLQGGGYMRNRFADKPSSSASHFKASYNRSSHFSQINSRKRRYEDEKERKRRAKHHPYASQSNRQIRQQKTHDGNRSISTKQFPAQSDLPPSNTDSKTEPIIIYSQPNVTAQPKNSTNATIVSKTIINIDEHHSKNTSANLSNNSFSNNSEIIVISDDESSEEKDESFVSSGFDSPSKGTKRKCIEEKLENAHDKHLKLNNSNVNVHQRYNRDEVRTLFENDKLSQQIRKFLVNNEQKPWFLAKKLELVEALEKSINEVVLSDCHLYLVGSSVSGFGRLNSDADMCLVVNPHLTTIKKNKALNILYKLKRLLLQATFARNLQIINAKVSILKFKDITSGMECDININNLTGLRNTQLMYAYAQCDPRVRPLVLCVKEWAHERDINDASQGSLSSYCLVLMVLHYLQFGVTPCVVPSLQNLHSDLFLPSIPIHLLKKRALAVPVIRSENRQSLSDLLIGFFQYFAKYDFKKVMSVRRGDCFIPSESGFSNPWKEKMIRIEEPFDLSNVARAVQREFAPSIISLFRNASMILKPNCNLKKLIRSADV